MKLHKIFLGLGSNLGNREGNLLMAQRLIKEKVGQIVLKSSIYETAAWGIVEQNSFLNQVIEVETSFSPNAVLHLILNIEKDMGRVRQVKWGERIIDIDILYYENEVISMENLSIPHPFIQERQFVLVPLCEIAANFIHPKLEVSNLELLKNCQDVGEISLFIG
ncbi:Bifunctional folate synthesis protein [Emticicia aquatica]|uniref:2-amino-4-hydroxy-6-hydroxymethyldihydropteridine pyrophosphokinase n=1 Tax=Emticicia aquatica TaxID=1681835 RepID=A0ABM9ASM1_9BACT|nr:2-amino-4-hydroxy-6-hydroxymethyldihydropteridine diphosphokinase [Emticicia aquatica]CAH0996699.1 Bifunctional folate synthesis protein [Emticicia aquatica]